jgi:hypothetical protein
MIWLLAHHLPSPSTREMGNMNRGPTFENFVTIFTEGRCRTTGCKTTEYKSTDNRVHIEGRDKKGGMYLPSQLEHTLQLCA